MAKLISQSQKVEKDSGTGLLTSFNSAFFKVSFERDFERGYCFDNVSQRALKEFNKFIKHTVGKNMTIQQVNSNYLRKPDANDTIDKFSIIHYEVNKKFRIHGYNKDGYFVICRIDPNHKYHN